ncbi:hypothetical protein TGVEG_231230 [Toxoplasma gondii VEG]|uniref:Uncharacterized protein n=1 Tax=Toxoplasma gondii (strain ATCC 50861 / VEG) TaxID=432359 RepID=V4ZQ46_TOXGV|nr:hypothetical protein TGVEG_231230 [Toxoplasma gondii VEG]
MFTHACARARALMCRLVDVGASKRASVARRMELNRGFCLHGQGWGSPFEFCAFVLHASVAFFSAYLLSSTLASRRQLLAAELAQGVCLRNMLAGLGETACAGFFSVRPSHGEQAFEF